MTDSGRFFELSVELFVEFRVAGFLVDVADCVARGGDRRGHFAGGERDVDERTDDVGDAEATASAEGRRRRVLR